MTSSDGCFSRQSRYSLKKTAVAIIVLAACWSGSAEPSCRLCWTISRRAAWSFLGMPTSIPMTCTGSFSEKSFMKSKLSRPSISSTISVHTWRIWASRPLTARGVNRRETMPRCRVCSGGSSLMNIPGTLG